MAKGISLTLSKLQSTSNILLVTVFLAFSKLRRLLIFDMPKQHRYLSIDFFPKLTTRLNIRSIATWKKPEFMKEDKPVNSYT